MELKYQIPVNNQCVVLAFNRTAYGIEIPLSVLHREIRRIF